MGGGIKGRVSAGVSGGTLVQGEAGGAVQVVLCTALVQVQGRWYSTLYRVQVVQCTALVQGGTGGAVQVVLWNGGTVVQEEAVVISRCYNTAVVHERAGVQQEPS